MKKISLVLLGATLIVSSLLLFSFKTPSNRPKPLSAKTFYYLTGTNDQRIEGGHNTAGKEHSIISSLFADPDNWIDVNQGATAYTSGDGSSYLNSITFEWESVSDGPDDGVISLQEALTNVWSVYSVTGILPATVSVCGSTACVTVTTTRAENAN